MVVGQNTLLSGAFRVCKIGTGKLASETSSAETFHVICETREKVLHQDIQTQDSVLSGYPNIKNRVEITMRSELFVFSISPLMRVVDCMGEKLTLHPVPPHLPLVSLTVPIWEG